MIKYYHLFVIFLMVLSVEGQLRNGFYFKSCPHAEYKVRSTVESHFNTDPTIAAGLLRLHFHDCFVQGCDGSVLINGPEKSALGHFGLRGFEVIDEAKSAVEACCPGVVSCADIVALAARDAVYLSGGPSWSVPTGRRDGLNSPSSEEVINSIPLPNESVATQKQKFAAKGLNDHDLVTLVGAHTIGQTDCRFFSYRLYNFNTTGNADPTINKSFLPQLEALCPKDGDASKRVSLDKDSQLEFDASFYKNVQLGNGVLESDQRLWEDATTRKVVQNYAGNIKGFNVDFPKAMVKMSRIEVKVGTNGEIRKVCSQIN